MAALCVAEFVFATESVVKRDRRLSSDLIDSRLGLRSDARHKDNSAGRRTRCRPLLHPPVDGRKEHHAGLRHAHGIQRRTPLPRFLVHRSRRTHHGSDRLCHHIALPPRPLRSPPLHVRDRRILRTHLHDSPHQSHCTNIVRRHEESGGRT